MDDSRAKSVSQLLSAFFDEKTLQRGEQYAQFSRSWRSIVGDRLADHSKPSDIRHGVLVIETDHSGWIQLLQLKQERILAEITKRYPELDIHGLAFRIGYGCGEKRVVEDVVKAENNRSQPGSDAELQDTAENKKVGENSKLPEFLLKKFEHIRKNLEKR